MKAIVQDRYGPEALELREVDRPEPGDRDVLVRVRAASIHPGDWFLTTGRPYVMRAGWGLRGPRKKIPGFDLAGTVEAVGSGVEGIAPGDEVFGTAGGSCAEYAVTRPGALHALPGGLGFEEAAPLAVSGTTALRGIRDVGKVQAGQHVLVNGASGGVGTFAVQIAKALGAEVTGVCSGRNADLVRSIGADHVIDYTTEDFTAGGERYDLILDNAASHTLKAMRGALVPTGLLVPNNGTSGGDWFGPLGRVLGAMATSPFLRRQGPTYVATPKPQDLADLAAMVADGSVKAVVGATFPLEDTPEAMRRIGAGATPAKTVITV
ncbi:MAG: NAD(P)-dependent alcohol dehydrogenase [Actinobacteria bacterium]|nr:NAD(P)-dependent alcohol dehydrogenase [Actinomycetota bacterium]